MICACGVICDMMSFKQGINAALKLTQVGMAVWWVRLSPFSSLLEVDDLKAQELALLCLVHSLRYNSKKKKKKKSGKRRRRLITMAEKPRVCVTGAGSYIASWLVKCLLSRGYFVHGTVRDPCDEKNAHLKKLDNAAENLILFKADLFDCQSLCSAIAGCTGVFHVACPVPNVVEAPVAETEVVEAAVTGTRNVLEACIKVKVKKVVVVSSIGAVMFIPSWPKDRVMDEECWSDIEFLRSLKGPMANYLLAKTMAEKEVLEYEKRSDLEIVTVCPSITIGPRLQPRINTSSLFLLKLLRDGIESMEDSNVNLVDVRDVADALLLVYENQETKGRYICNSHSPRLRALTEKLNSMYPNYNLPKRITEKKENEYEEHGLMSLEKLRKLGWQYKPLEETIADSVTNFEEIGDLPKTVTAS